MEILYFTEEVDEFAAQILRTYRIRNSAPPWTVRRKNPLRKGQRKPPTPTRTCSPS